MVPINPSMNAVSSDIRYTRAQTMVYLRYPADKIFFQNFSKGHNSKRGDNSEKKKNMGQLFFIRNPHMKFQDSSFNGLKVTVGTKSVMHASTHTRSKSNMPHQLFQS